MHPIFSRLERPPAPAPRWTIPAPESENPQTVKEWDEGQLKNSMGEIQAVILTPPQRTSSPSSKCYCPPSQQGSYKPSWNPPLCTAARCFFLLNRSISGRTCMHDLLQSVKPVRGDSNLWSWEYRSTMQSDFFFWWKVCKNMNAESVKYVTTFCLSKPSGIGACLFFGKTIVYFGLGLQNYSP